ncbi:MAG TPA: ATP-binding protein [Caulobacteraceae bacterium]|jgi:signal transduction histidine kinase/ActR/RegA family two-component response regulator
MPRASVPATLALAIDDLPMPLVVLDARGRVRAANRAFAAFLPVGGRVAGRKLEALFEAAGVASADTGYGTVFRLRRDGGERAFKITRTAHGDGQIAALTDITEAHLAADQLRLAHGVRAQLMHDAEIGPWRYDPDADVYYFSSELSLGHEGISAPVPTAALAQLQHDDDRGLDTEIRERITREGGSAESEMRYRNAEGGWTHLKVLYRAGAKLPSGRYEMFGLSVSITDFAKARDAASALAQRLDAATRAKSDFLASVSHEIRTPMNGIVGVLNLLRREGLSDEGRQLLEEALGCTGMLSELINDVLDFSKIEAGKLELAPAPTDPAAVTIGVVSLLRPQAAAKGLALSAEIGVGVRWAELDPVRLRQILFNVVGNAVKFTEAGGVTVRVSAEGAAGAPRLRFEIEDSGIGVPEAARGRLFGRFEQADAGPARKFGGTGLGLAISRQLARLMGGELDFRSREGQGSTFWFEVAAPPAAAPQDAAAELGEAPLAGLVVLVVDDNRVNRLVGVKSLEALGASAEAVESGPAAIEAVQARAFDLVLMDVNMPGMDGLEATRRIRALDVPAALAPIVALTADVMRHQREACLAAGMNGIVAKPFSPAQLLAELARLTDNAAEAGVEAA